MLVYFVCLDLPSALLLLCHLALTKLTDGWKEFAIAHDLRIGDILIFRQEKDMAFHVTLLGPSGCEFQYESCSEEENNLGELCSVSV